ncbi:Zn-dependent amino-or carboxypeptidase, M28 family [Sphingopyxis sp. YR583]|jgi:Zn-dependent M28 family amino/carboxypeptidase|uniref:M28 family metallopeptidase n=1 Tax=Sphingopyxis sp. YR583 TaxID=1881047 RepID=UPI0008A7EF6E|nr:M28 family metallopeptidase [Sphingopyxis sp. YR583]SEH20197.1 Zn-dependent amino-or carboxypeptidase, M28 family [Sphingopyxis sp. YR583]
MLRFPRTTAALAVLLTVAACNSSDKAATSAVAIPDVQIPELSLATLQEVTKELSSDAYEGRAPGTAGEEKTVAYIIKKYEEAGLKPGNNGKWTQDVPLVEITAKNATPISFTGGKTPVTAQYAKDYVAFSWRVQPKTEVKDSDVVFVGYGINAPEKGWNDYAGLDVKGKTVVVLVNDPDWQTKEAKGEFNGRAMTYYGRWSYKYEEAARQGAAAVLIVHDTEPAAYGWNVVESSNTGTQYLAESKNGGADQTVANGWIQLPKAKELFASAGQDFDKLRAAAGKKGFKPVALTGVKANFGFDNEIAKKMSRNVIGVLPGAKRPDEYVLYTGHWDHLGRCTPVAGDDICNGAVDNASGIAGLVTLAQAFHKAGAPDRSIVFLAVTAEESGLLGSKYYAENPIFPLAQTVGGVNMDALNAIGPAKDIVVVGGGKSELDAYVEKLAKMEGRTIKAEPTPEKGFYYRSDHFSFAKLGVPMFNFGSGDELVEGGVEAGKKAAEDYEKNRYHAPGDEYEAITNWGGMMSDLRLYYAAGRMLAMTDAWPNWVEGDEFRAARDKSRAGK